MNETLTDNEKEARSEEINEKVKEYDSGLKDSWISENKFELLERFVNDNDEPNKLWVEFLNKEYQEYQESL